MIGNKGLKTMTKNRGVPGRRMAVALAAALWLGVGPAHAAGKDDFTPTEKEQAQLEFFEQSNDWFAKNLKNPPEIIDGQHLHPKIQYMLEQQRASWVPDFVHEWIFRTSWGRAYVRSALDRGWMLFSKVTAPMQNVEDRMIDGRGGPIHIRIYHPQTDEKAPLPILVYFHGGGWIMASVEALDRATRLMANEANAIVISVDYRLAPEHSYPAASDDGEDAYLWARNNAVALGGTPDMVAVGGDSAGGHVAINISQRQLLAGKPAPAYQLLYYPGTSLPRADASFEKFGKGYGLDQSFINFIIPRVFPGRDENQIARDGLIEPLHAQSLKGLPPTILSTAGFDILRDSGRTFAERLEAEGVPVHYTNYPSLIHSFLQLTAVIDDADKAATESARLFGTEVRRIAAQKERAGAD